MGGGGLSQACRAVQDYCLMSMRHNMQIVPLSGMSAGLLDSIYSTIYWMLSFKVMIDF